MAQNKKQNDIINNVVSPIIAKALQQNASEQAYKKKEISFEDIKHPLREYLDTLDKKAKRETLYCIEWYQDFLKKTITYMKGDLDLHEGTLTDSEYLDSIDSDLIEVQFNIDTKEKFESNENAGTPRCIQETYGFSKDFIDEKLNHSKIAKAIKNKDPNVLAAINAGAITITENKTRKFKVSIKEENE